MFYNSICPQREQVCKASFQCCGEDVAVISRLKDSKIRLSYIEAHNTVFHLSALLV